MAMRAIMYSFGAHEQDAEGNLTINSPQTLEALKFVKALFEETMTPEVLAWDAVIEQPADARRALVAGAQRHLGHAHRREQQAADPREDRARQGGARVRCAASASST